MLKLKSPRLGWLSNPVAKERKSPWRQCLEEAKPAPSEETPSRHPLQDNLGRHPRRHHEKSTPTTYPGRISRTTLSNQQKTPEKNQDKHAKKMLWFPYVHCREHSVNHHLLFYVRFVSALKLQFSEREGKRAIFYSGISHVCEFFLLLKTLSKAIQQPWW